MPGTEVTQHAWERTWAIIPQDPAGSSRQEKWRGWRNCSLIISLDKFTSSRRVKKTAKSISDHSHDTTLSAQDLGLSGKLRSALNLCCLPRRTRKSKWNNSNVTECTNQSQTMKNRRMWEEPLCMRLKREKKEDLPTEPRNYFILLITVRGAQMYIGTKAVICTNFVQNQVCLNLENATLCVVN